MVCFRGERDQRKGGRGIRVTRGGTRARDNCVWYVMLRNQPHKIQFAHESVHWLYSKFETAVLNRRVREWFRWVLWLFIISNEYPKYFSSRASLQALVSFLVWMSISSTFEMILSNGLSTDTPDKFSDYLHTDDIRTWWGEERWNFRS